MCGPTIQIPLPGPSAPFSQAGREGGSFPLKLQGKRRADPIKYGQSCQRTRQANCESQRGKLDKQWFRSFLDCECKTTAFCKNSCSLRSTLKEDLPRAQQSWQGPDLVVGSVGQWAPSSSCPRVTEGLEIRSLYQSVSRIFFTSWAIENVLAGGGWGYGLLLGRQCNLLVFSPSWAHIQSKKQVYTLWHPLFSFRVYFALSSGTAK